MYPTFAERLKTFENGNWPIDFLKPEDLAEMGFYRPNHNSNDDTVKCMYCNIEESNWQFDDIPFLRHICPASYHLAGINTCCPCCTVKKHSLMHTAQPAWPQYCCQQVHQQSFHDWPSYIPVKAEELAEAGFFYSGTADHTTCFYCGGTLHDWVDGDDPWGEHYRWFPRCMYLWLKNKSDLADDEVDLSKSVK
ncbi:death-associated inhibitor of apoptosis 1-like [Schistocerca piceifrons]|uniref:death-associated inhibitor of apoptosis 1-like n=1 Tax=Schistocerca piceifrons TaxID=274613 RepID=UPI001F5E6BAD|nr:death-associated inhibitor of apoptosis 1-like [Schistocerca piceifrons]